MMTGVPLIVCSAIALSGMDTQPETGDASESKLTTQVQSDSFSLLSSAKRSDGVGEEYGNAETEQLTVLSIFAPNLSGEFDAGLSLQYTTFLIDGFEVGAEGTFWGFFQNDDTVGVSAGLVMRYHFYRAERWSAFAEAGMGAAVSGDDVPDGGTSFNLMPRLAAGLTWRMFEDSPTRLVTGLRWHHLSNARIKGEEDNPARDAPGLFVGVTFEF